jgi:hypothetical protein
MDLAKPKIPQGPLLPVGQTKKSFNITTNLTRIIVFVIALSITIFSYFPRPSVADESKPSLCPQHAPLVPPTNSKLDATKEYLKSTAWRNSTIQHHGGAVRVKTETFGDLGKIGEDERWDVFYDVGGSK